MARAGLASSTSSKNSSSIPVACREKTLKFTPPSRGVAPSGELAPKAELWDGTRLGMPDLGGVLGDGAVARELARASHVKDGLARPLIAVRVQLEQPAIRLEVAREIGQVHVVVTARQEGLPQRFEDPRLIAAEVVREDQLEGRA